MSQRNYEECFQLTSEEDFNKLDMSIRGKLPPALFHQLILTFNPWSDRHWLKRRFFDNPDENTLAITTNYMMNEFLSESDLRLYEIMRERYPRRYRIEGLGEWGIAEGLIFENWREEDFDIEELIERSRNKRDGRGLTAFVPVNGMDFGYNDPTAFVAAYADKADYKIYIYYEFYEVQMENRRIAARLMNDGFGDEVILADSEDPRTINELRLLGLRGIRGARKGAGSVLGGIQKLQDYELVVSPRCQHMIEALCNYAWKKDKMTDRIMNEPEHEFSHLCVSGDTRIITARGKVRIRDLVGRHEQVYCYDTDKGEMELRECFGAHITGINAEVYEVTLADGQRLRMTANHKVLTERGYVKCRNLTADDEVLCGVVTWFDALRYAWHYFRGRASRRKNAAGFSRVRTVQVKSVKLMGGRETVYNMTVDKNHNYCVEGGAIIKNCDALRYACEDLSRFGMQV